MTIASTTSKVSYNGAGSAGPFSIPFKFLKDADIVATKRSSLGVETVLSLTTHYTLAGAGEASGGALTLVTALAVGESLVIARVPGIVQEVDYVENSAFPAETHEGALDLLTTICQSLQEQINRSVKVEISSTTSPGDLLAEIAVDVAGAAAAVDAAETAQGLAEDARDAAIAAAASVPTFGAFGVTLAATTTASNARASLALGTAAVADTGTGAGDVPVLDAGGKLDASVFPSTAGTDAAARDIAIFDSLLNQIDLGRASGAIPSGYMHLFASDELATKTGAAYDAANKRYSNYSATPSYANPGGTGNRTSSITCSLPAQMTGGVASYLVDGTTTIQTGMWFASQPNTSSYFPFDFGAGAAKVISEFKLYQSAAAAQGVWKWQGMVDGGSSYEDIVGSINVGDAGNATSTHAIGATYTKGYRYFRLAYVSGTINGSPNWDEFEFKIDNYSTGVATLIPTAITAGAAPNTMDIYLVHKAVDTVSLGTDLKVRASRDNGSHWSGYGDLSTLCSFDATYNLLKCTVDLSALPTGTNVKWEITAPTGKSQLWRAVAALLR